MPKYNEINFDPPAPVATVELKNLETNEGIKNISMLLDTGADITLLPKSVVKILIALNLSKETMSWKASMEVGAGRRQWNFN
jgi:predicted aspartyl protease